MKLLVIDTDNVGLAFCLRCAEAGHEVRWFVKPKDSNSPLTGKGFNRIYRISNWVSSVMWADVVFTTSNDDYLERLDFFRKKGARVFGPSVESAKLEIKRADGMKFLEKNGIEVPPYKTFKSLKDAEEYVWKNEERFVFKPMGDEADKALTYCSKSPADMIATLQRWQKMGFALKGECMLQTFIEGNEFAVSRWMGKEGWVGLPNINWEHKPLMSSGCGPNTGEAGTVMAYVEQDKLFDDCLNPLEQSLLKLGHLGDIDVNCIIDKQGKAYPLEFTMRPGWPAFNIMLSTHKGDPLQWMYDAIDGKDTMQVSQDIAIGVVLAIPPYPNEVDDPKQVEDIPIYGVTSKNKKYLFPQSVMISKKPDMEGSNVVERPIWTTSGEYVMIVTGTGKTISQANERVYSTVKEIDIKNKMYRDDIGESLKDKLPEIQQNGYATGIKF